MNYLNGNLRILTSDQQQDHQKTGYGNNGCLGSILSFKDAILDFYFPKGNITSITSFTAVKKERAGVKIIDSATTQTLDATQILLNASGNWVHNMNYIISPVLSHSLWELQMVVVDSVLGATTIRSEVFEVKDKSIPSTWITVSDFNNTDFNFTDFN